MYPDLHDLFTSQAPRGQLTWAQTRAESSTTTERWGPPLESASHGSTWALQGGGLSEKYVCRGGPESHEISSPECRMANQPERAAYHNIDEGSTSASDPPIPSSETKGKAPAKPSRRRKSLTLLTTLPLEVVFEILGHLGPKDLFNLSQIDKSWRSLVVNQKTAFLWRDARIVYDAPDPPKDITEHRWARLLFVTSCGGCARKNISRVEWRLLRRICDRCKKQRLINWNGFHAVFPGEDIGVLKYVPYTYSSQTRRRSGVGKLYWDNDVSSALEKMKALLGKDLEEWKLDAVKKIEERDVALKTYEEWTFHMHLRSISNAADTRKKRLQAITQRFLQEGYELVDIEKAFNIRSPRVRSGAPYITNAVWTRLRAELEIPLIKIKNQRLDAEMAHVVTQRMAILGELYQLHLDHALRPSERSQAPLTVEVFRHHPDFASLLKTDKERDLTAKDFEPLTRNFGTYLTEYVDRKKSSLRDIVPPDRRGTNLELPCDLARHVFRHAEPLKHLLWSLFHQKAKEIWDDVLVGWPMIAPFCHSSPSGPPGEVWNVPAQVGYNLDASKISSNLICLSGLQPETATVQDMDANDPRFVASSFETGSGYPILTWRAALGVASALQQERFGWDCDFRLATEEETAEAKLNEDFLRGQVKAWSCNHCPQRTLAPEVSFTRPDVIEHLFTVHKVPDPNLHDDYFVSERNRHIFETPYEVVVPSLVQKYKCVGGSCTCQNFQYRRFTREELVRHVQQWSGVPEHGQVEGVHYVSVPNAQDALHLILCGQTADTCHCSPLAAP